MRSTHPKFLFVLAVGVMAFGLLGHPSDASADERTYTIYVTGATGTTMGSGDGESVSSRSRFFMDFGLRTGRTSRPELSYGGSLRVELETQVGVAVVPHVAYAKEIGPLTIRPTLALPLFLYPFTMFGPELALNASFEIIEGFGVTASFAASVFPFGTDVPNGQVVFMLNGFVGVELEI